MSNGLSKLSFRAEFNQLKKKVDDFNKVVSNVFQAVNESLKKANDRLVSVEEISDAVATLLGTDEVAEQIRVARKKRAEDAVKHRLEAVDLALKAGTLVVSEAFSDKSVAVGVERDKDGNVVGTDQQVLLSGEFLPNVKALLLGKKPGDKVTLENETTFELTALYDEVETVNMPVSPELQETPPTETVAPETVEDTQVEVVTP